MQVIHQQTGMLAKLMEGQSELHNSIQRAAGSEQEACTIFPKTPTAENIRCESATLAIRAFVPWNDRSPCSRSCKCQCHKNVSLQSPQILRQILGALFVGYSGRPDRRIRSCTVQHCISQSTFRVHVHFFFPFWFLNQILTVALISTPLVPFDVSMTLRQTLFPGSEVHLLIAKNDVEGLKPFFDQRLAYPNMWEVVSGQSLLMVSQFLYPVEIQMQSCDLEYTTFIKGFPYSGRF